ncbi:hypothetical protein, partial [Corallococcus exiguus]|uniref:hypothetical protein n=1 Tax=Corallococcus exiguus TaxID=83462 RepID=UPI001C60B735
TGGAAAPDGLGGLGGPGEVEHLVEAQPGALSTPRYNQATTALSTGDILVAGGYLSPSVLNPSVELYRP